MKLLPPSEPLKLRKSSIAVRATRGHSAEPGTPRPQNPVSPQNVVKVPQTLRLEEEAWAWGLEEMLLQGDPKESMAPRP